MTYYNSYRKCFVDLKVVEKRQRERKRDAELKMYLVLLRYEKKTVAYLYFIMKVLIFLSLFPNELSI